MTIYKISAKSRTVTEFTEIAEVKQPVTTVSVESVIAQLVIKALTEYGFGSSVRVENSSGVLIYEVTPPPK